MALPAEVARAVNAAANRAADKASRTAVKETLMALGIDVSSPGAVVEFQKDMAHMRRVRTFGEARSTKYGLAAIGLAFSVAGGMAVAYAKKIMGW